MGYETGFQGLTRKDVAFHGSKLLVQSYLSLVCKQPYFFCAQELNFLVKESAYKCASLVLVIHLGFQIQRHRSKKNTILKAYVCQSNIKGNRVFHKHTHLVHLRLGLMFSLEINILLSLQENQLLSVNSLSRNINKFTSAFKTTSE